jgi:hypothetical protein
LKIRVYQAEKLSMEEIRRFVAASEGLHFQGRHRAEVYGWMEQVLVGQQYATLP